MLFFCQRLIVVFCSMYQELVPQFINIYNKFFNYFLIFFFGLFKYFNKIYFHNCYKQNYSHFLKFFSQSFYLIIFKIEKKSFYKCIFLFIIYGFKTFDIYHCKVGNNNKEIKSPIFIYVFIYTIKDFFLEEVLIHYSQFLLVFTKKVYFYILNGNLWIHNI